MTFGHNFNIESQQITTNFYNITVFENINKWALCSFLIVFIRVCSHYSHLTSGRVTKNLYMELPMALARQSNYLKRNIQSRQSRHEVVLAGGICVHNGVTFIGHGIAKQICALLRMTKYSMTKDLRPLVTRHLVRNVA